MTAPAVTIRHRVTARTVIEALADRLHEPEEYRARAAGLRVTKTPGAFGLLLNRTYRMERP